MGFPLMVVAAVYAAYFSMFIVAVLITWAYWFGWTIVAWGQTHGRDRFARIWIYLTRSAACGTFSNRQFSKMLTAELRTMKVQFRLQERRRRRTSS
jgi:hypothetical protein